MFKNRIELLYGDAKIAFESVSNRIMHKASMAKIIIEFELEKAGTSILVEFVLVESRVSW